MIKVYKSDVYTWGDLQRLQTQMQNDQCYHLYIYFYVHFFKSC